MIYYWQFATLIRWSSLRIFISLFHFFFQFSFLGASSLYVKLRVQEFFSFLVRHIINGYKSREVGRTSFLFGGLCQFLYLMSPYVFHVQVSILLFSQLAIFSFSFLARWFPSVCDFHVLLVQSFHSPWYSGFFLVFQGLIC